MKVVQDKSQKEPYILVIGSLESIQQAFLVIDCETKYEIDADDIIFGLMSCYYVFNICYCKGTYDLFQFLEVVLFDHRHGKITPSVLNFISIIQ